MGMTVGSGNWKSSRSSRQRIRMCPWFTPSKAPPVRVIEIIKPGNSVIARTWALIARASNIKDVVVWHQWLWSLGRCRRSRAQTQFFLPSGFLKYIRYQSLCRYDRKERSPFLKDQCFCFVFVLPFLCCCSMSGDHPTNDFVLMAKSFENLEKIV